MKILVIPDVHLKPQMFKQATALMHQGIADRAVCLMDIPDDWDKQYNVGLYEETYPMRRKTPCFSYGDIRRVHRIYASN